MTAIKGRQYRAMPVMSEQSGSKRIESDYYVEGYAANYNRYKLFELDDGPVWEQFRKDDFIGTDMSDIIMQYNHAGRVFARNRNGSLVVEVDDKGLFIGADLGRTEGARELYSDISAKMIDRMSWCFMPGEIEYDPKERLITYKGIKKIYDVSAVSLPANDTTEISARSYVEKLQERLRCEVIEANRQRLRLKLKCVM